MYENLGGARPPAPRFRCPWLQRHPKASGVELKFHILSITSPALYRLSYKTAIDVVVVFPEAIGRTEQTITLFDAYKEINNLYVILDKLRLQNAMRCFLGWIKIGRNCIAKIWKNFPNTMPKFSTENFLPLLKIRKKMKIFHSLMSLTMFNEGINLS